jgi:alanyl-tRNA synthetase
MGEMFPELKRNPQHVMDIIKDEEISFGNTLDRGIALFDEAAVRSIENRKSKIENAVISAADAFKLYDTYGFPIDLTRIMAEERGMTVDLAGYEKLMEQAKELSRAADKSAGNPVYDLPPNIIDELAKLNIHATDDSHKFKRGPTRATVRAIWTGVRLDQFVDASRPGEQLALILDKSNFYSEMGGQVGDTGELRSDENGSGADALVGGGGGRGGSSGGGVIFIVEATRAIGPYVLHIGRVKMGRIRVADGVTCYVLGGRERTEKNHTSTHLANWALRETLGDHVQQKGSLVDPDKLRFDFLHQKSMADDEIAQVESLVNSGISARLPVYAEVAPQEKALKIFGLRAVFGEKYPPMVRVVSIGVPVADLLQNPDNPEWKKYSIEFCGGTHLFNAAEAERFVITSEESVSKGIRRIVALTGAAAIAAAHHAQLIESLLASSRTVADAVLPTHISALQKAIADPHTPLLSKRTVHAAIAQLQDRYKKWQKSQALSAPSAGGAGEVPGGSSFDPESLLAQADAVNGIALIVATVPDANADTLRSTWDWLKKKHPQQNIAVLLASEFTDTDKDGNKLPPKVNLLAAVGDPHINKLKAGDWVKAVAPLVGGTGGGRPQLAMAGGKDTAKIPAALDAAKAFAKQKLA